MQTSSSSQSHIYVHLLLVPQNHHRLRIYDVCPIITLTRPLCFNHLVMKSKRSVGDGNNKGKKARAILEDAGGKSVSESEKGKEGGSRKRQTFTELLQIDLVHVFTVCSPATLLRLSLSSCELRVVVAEKIHQRVVSLMIQGSNAGLLRRKRSWRVY